MVFVKFEKSLKCVKSRMFNRILHKIYIIKSKMFLAIKIFRLLAFRLLTNKVSTINGLVSTAVKKFGVLLKSL